MIRASRTDSHLVRVMTVVAGVVASLFTLLFSRQLPYVTTVHPVSVLLPLLLVGQLLFIVFAASAQSQLRTRDTLIHLRGGIFGRASRRVARRDFRRAYVVGNHGTAEICHLLLDTDSGPLASRVRAEEAKQFWLSSERALQG